MTPGERLRAWRRDQGITQRVLAMRMGVVNQAVSKWETGDSPPSLAHAAWIERRAGIPATAWRDTTRVRWDRSRGERRLQAGSPGAKLRAWRIRTGTTQGQLADQVGVANVAVGKWERGERNPLPICARRIERITGIPAGAWDEIRSLRKRPSRPGESVRALGERARGHAKVIAVGRGTSLPDRTERGES